MKRFVSTAITELGIEVTIHLTGAELSDLENSLDTETLEETAISMGKKDWEDFTNAYKKWMA